MFSVRIASGRSFNSRPHAEVDLYTLKLFTASGLSTHDLTQRSTSAFTTQSSRRYLSTHDLTQRSTPYFGLLFRLEELSTHDLTQRSTPQWWPMWSAWLLSTHDLTQRSTVREIPQELLGSAFNSRPHAEVDRGDERLEPCHDLSTHDLTQRST